MKQDKIYIMDTTLRDGIQAAPVSVSYKDRVEIANRLFNVNVDSIEAGFPMASQTHFDIVRYVATNFKGETMAMARAVKKDIDRAGEALEDCIGVPIIHTFVATSPIHMERKFKKTPAQVYEMGIESIKYAKQIVGENGLVQFSCEDATRSKYQFLRKMIKGAILAGADIINIPDTVGYAQPEEIRTLMKNLYKDVPALKNVRVSIHCHNDLGNAVSNSLQAISCGARQVECTINGVGERAGNTSLEEIVGNILVRKDIYPFRAQINTQSIAESSLIVSEKLAMVVQPNKAIVGSNAFAHRSGIHQDGALKDLETYEIMTPEDWGFNRVIEITDSSGSAALKHILEQNSIEVEKGFLVGFYAKVMEKVSEIGRMDEKGVIEFYHQMI